MELEKRYRELTDLLVTEYEICFFCCSSNIYFFVLTSCDYSILQYYKQTQLETMASEKAAAEFQLEKEIKRLQEAQVCQYPCCKTDYLYLVITNGVQYPL